MTTALSNATKMYASFHGLAQLKHQVTSQSPDQREDALREMAKQFESIFIQMAIKSMRDANRAFKSELFQSNQLDFYEDMYDKQLALHLSDARFGIADMLMKQLSTFKGAQQGGEQPGQLKQLIEISKRV